MRALTADADAMTCLPDGLVIDTKDEIGMRDLTTQLRLFLLGQITPVAVVLDHLKRTARPAARMLRRISRATRRVVRGEARPDV